MNELIEKDIEMTKYVFDIDGTLCTDTKGNYTEALPLEDRIAMVNKLFEDGHQITLYTARGMGSSGNFSDAAKSKWESLTLKQLEIWGVKFHNIFFGKPAGDVYVDDKGITDIHFFE